MHAGSRPNKRNDICTDTRTQTQQVQGSDSKVRTAHKFTRTSLFSAIWLYPGLQHLLR